MGLYGVVTAYAQKALKGTWIRLITSSKGKHELSLCQGGIFLPSEGVPSLYSCLHGDPTRLEPLLEMSNYKVALFVFFPFRKELLVSPLSPEERAAQKQQLWTDTRLPSTPHGLFVEGNVLDLLTFPLAGKSKSVSLLFFLFN